MKKQKSWDILASKCQVVFSRFGAVEQTAVYLMGKRADWLMEDKYEFWKICQNGEAARNEYLKKRLRKCTIFRKEKEPLEFYFRDGTRWCVVNGSSIFGIGAMSGKLELYKRLKHEPTNVKVEEGMFEYNGRNKGEVVKNLPNITGVRVASSF